MNLNLTIEQQEKLNKKLKKNKQTMEEYLRFLVISDIDSKFDLGKGFYYNFYIDKFFDNKDNEIYLSITQKKILKYLIKYNNQIVSTEELIKNCWSNKKEVSIFTLRNMIKQIRDKSHYLILKNHSSKGYSIYSE